MEWVILYVVSANLEISIFCLVKYTVERLGNTGKKIIGCILFSLSSLVTRTRVQGNGMKLCQGRLNLDIRQRFFTRRVTGHWNRLPQGIDDGTKSAGVQGAFGKCS